MGCDIHLYVEKRVGDKWEAVPGPNPWHGMWDDEPEERLNDWIWDGRHYDLFAIMANVRNGYGFAGCDTGDGFVPIAMPKGLPDDVSPAIKASADGWGCDGHSYSWLTLRELQEYDWNRVTKHRGIVSEAEYLEFKKNGKPESWCGGVSGPNVVHVSPAQMDDIVAGNVVREEGKQYYTKVEWEETYRETVGFIVDEILQKMAELGGPDDVRLVFWFDS